MQTKRDRSTKITTLCSCSLSRCDSTLRFMISWLSGLNFLFYTYDKNSIFIISRMINCPSPPLIVIVIVMQMIRFFLSNNIELSGLRIQNSPQFHIKFDGCNGVLIDKIQINSPQCSPNTDGIHVENTQNVGIYNSMIANGNTLYPSLIVEISKFNVLYSNTPPHTRALWPKSWMQHKSSSYLVLSIFLALIPHQEIKSTKSLS